MKTNRAKLNPKTVSSLNKILGKLGALYKNKDVHEILVSAYDDIDYAERGSLKKFTKAFDNDSQVEQAIAKIFDLAGVKKLVKNKINYCRLPDGTHVSAVLPPMAVKGAAFNMIKMPSSQQAITMEDLKKWGAIDDKKISLLKNIVESNKSILISHSPNSGINTFINCFINECIPSSYRVVTLEKRPEIMTERKRMVQLNVSDDEGLKEALENVRGLRPDFLVINSTFNQEAAHILDVLRDGIGGLVSLRAEDGMDALRHLEIKILQSGSVLTIAEIRQILAKAFPYVASMNRHEDGKRSLDNISEVTVDEQGRFRLTKL